MSKNLPYSRQCIEQDDIQAVVEVLKSDFLTQGSKVVEFEKALAEYCGAKYATTFSSGTAALHGAYFAAGLSGGDEIITSPITFLATANAAVYLGAKAAFVDIEPDTGNINSDLIEKAVTKKTKLLAPVHYSGLPVDLEAVSRIAKKHNLILVEDACHALGAKYRDTRIGDCAFSDMAVFSFHPVKSITTGEGGAVTTNSEELYNKLVMFRQHGVTKDEKFMTKAARQAGEWYYEMHYLGFNYRLTDMQAALGISQLRKIDRLIGRRKEIALRYLQAFGGNDYFDIPAERSGANSSWHLYPIRLKDKYVRHKTEMFKRLRSKGLRVQVHYIPVYLQPYYQKSGYKRGLCPAAEDFYAREISIPLYPVLSDEDVQYVADVVSKVLTEFR